MKRLALLGILAVPLSGCASGTAEQDTAAQTDVIAVAEHYANALASHDWKAVCASRASAEQAALARTDGTCEAGVARVFKGKSTKVLLNAKAKHVRIKGNLAGVDLAQSNGLITLGRIGMVRENGHWRIADVPNDQIP